MINKLKKTMAFILSALMIFALLPTVTLPANATEPTPLPICVDGTISDFSGLVSDSSGTTLLRKTGDTEVNSSGQLQLTNSGTSLAGTVVRRSPIQLDDGFSTYFVANMSDLVGTGGDGLCFIVYDSSNGVQSGGTGINLGYSDYDGAGSIISGDSIAVELDTCCNDQYEGLLDKAGLNYRHVAIDTNDWDGSRPNNTPSQDPLARFDATNTGANILHSSYADSTSTVYSNPTDDGTNRVAHGYSDLNDGNDIHVWVDLTKNSDGTSEVTVTYGKSSTRSDSLNYSFKRQLSNQNILNNSVYVGFSASTGSVAEKHIIKNWYFSNTPISGGVDPVSDSYSQAVSTVSVSPNSATNPSTAMVMLYDASGTAMSGTADIYVDGICKITGASVLASGYVYSIPAGLSSGSHTVQAVATGGASGDAGFSILLASVELGNVTWAGASTYTCGIELSSSTKMVTISVDSGYFTVPSLGSALTYLGGTNGTNYIRESEFSSTTQCDSAVFSFDDPSAAADLLDDIIYTQGSATTQKITATSSAVSPIGNDLYFEGHFYRYVSGAINWPTAVINAGATTDSYFGGRGYIATATSQAENSILLKLVYTTEDPTDHDHYYNVYMGGLWQRNTGTVAIPAITRGTTGNEISYANIASAISGGTLTTLLPDYSATYGSIVADACNGTADGKYIYQHPETVKYYWIDGPEAGDEIEYNVEGGFSPWHSGEPNSGDFVYIGWQGAYWDDQSSDIDTGSYATLSGYIVEFSGFDGGSTEGTIKSDEKTVNASYAITYHLNDGTNAGGAPSWYVYGTGATLPTPTKSGYIFGGWYTDADFSSPDAATISTTDTGAKEYWAQWTAIPVNYSPSRTITVIETSSGLFAGNSGAVLAEANMNSAFSNSVEVKVTDTVEDTSSFGFGAGTDVYPFDISLYVKGTNNKTEPASGYAVTISLPIPEDLLDVRDQLSIVHKSNDGTVTTLTSSLKQIGGVWYLVFEATEFSPYALVISNLSSYDTAAGLPYYLDDNGNKVFIGFAADGKYLAPEGVTVLLKPNPKSFTDISSHWGKPYIDFVTEREIFVGTGANVFSPDTSMSRAMFATVIGRLYERSYGEISISDTRAFTDCNYADYYGKYVDWAAENGIIQGVGGSLFEPDRQVTHQEMAAMLYRFAKFMKLDTTATAGKTLSYPDASSIAPWAEDAALYCQEAGIITGRAGGNFVPDGTATRAEVSALLERFIETVV